MSYIVAPLAFLCVNGIIYNLPGACEQASGIDYENGVMKKQMVLELDMPTWQVRPLSTKPSLIIF